MDFVLTGTPRYVHLSCTFKIPSFWKTMNSIFLKIISVLVLSQNFLITFNQCCKRITLSAQLIACPAQPECWNGGILRCRSWSVSQDRRSLKKLFVYYIASDSWVKYRSCVSFCIKWIDAASGLYSRDLKYLHHSVHDPVLHVLLFLLHLHLL